MKTVETFKNNFILFTKESNHETIIYMMNRSNIETVKTHKTYDCFGQQVGHTNAGDYTFNNSECSAESDMLKEIGNKFTAEELEEIDQYLSNSEIDDMDISDEAKQLLNDWLSENYNLTECEAYTFWDGHNSKSLIFSDEFADNLDISECEDEVYERIYAELYNEDGEEAIEDYKEEPGKRIYETESFEFTDSCWDGTFAKYLITEK